MPRIDDDSTTSIFNPYWQTRDESMVKLYNGDVREILSKLPTRSVHMIVTSPPYWGLRDYGTALWEGGNPKCEHNVGRKNHGHSGTLTEKNEQGNSFRNSKKYVEQGSMTNTRECKRCGAKRIDQQIGSERIPDCGGRVYNSDNRRVLCGECFVCTMVGVFHLAKRVLRPEGTLWLNLGDSYAAPNNRNNLSGTLGGNNGRKPNNSSLINSDQETGLREGNLLGIPWRVALALQQDRWILRNDIVWAKPNPMPESVTNRCTKAHEYLFMFSKGSDYYYDMEAIKEPSKYYGKDKRSGQGNIRYEGKRTTEEAINSMSQQSLQMIAEMSQKRDVWTVATHPYKGAHFATFPLKLIEPCILAGTSEVGCCPECGVPWKRITSNSSKPPIDVFTNTNKPQDGFVSVNVTRMGMGQKFEKWRQENPKKSIGWKARCNCGHEKEDNVPCVVLDPFMGSGTTSAVCIEHGRHSIGIELNEKYLKENCIPRISNKLMSRPFTINLIPK